jgi:hypothetical protein
MSSSKKLTCKGTLKQVFICLRPRTPYPPPPTHYTFYRRIQNTYLKGKVGGKELNQKEGERGNRGEYRSQSWVENNNKTECPQEIGYLQSINSDIHLPQSPFTGQTFSMTTFCIDF